MASPVKDAAWLEWIAGLMGTGSRQTLTAPLPQDRFHCLVDELPLHLIPQGFHRSSALRKHVEQPLFLSPQCSIYPAGQWPQELEEHQELVSGFARQGTIAWVRDPASRSLLPFWLGPKLEALVRSLRPGEALTAALSREELFRLAASRILVPEGQAQQIQQGGPDSVSRNSLTFLQQGYLPLRSLLHPFHVAALRRYYRYQLRRGAFPRGDRDNPLRYVAKNEPVARFFHHQLTHTVSAVAGQRVKPSYVYFASYLSGAELTKHTDRPQCEFSVTLCLDFSPEPACETSWPIRLETSRGTVAVYQALGDGLVYRGPSVPHYRTALPEGHTSTSIFFHYVAEDFEGPLD
jgi:hypothetical protein